MICALEFIGEGVPQVSAGMVACYYIPGGHNARLHACPCLLPLDIYDTFSACIVYAGGATRTERSTVVGARLDYGVGCLCSLGVGFGRSARFGLCRSGCPVLFIFFFLLSFFLLLRPTEFSFLAYRREG